MRGAEFYRPISPTKADDASMALCALHVKRLRFLPSSRPQLVRLSPGRRPSSYPPIASPITYWPLQWSRFAKILCN